MPKTPNHRAANGKHALDGTSPEPRRWRLHRVSLLFVVLGLSAATLCDFYQPLEKWKEIGTLLGGILMGFCVLSIDDELRGRRDRLERARELHKHAKERAEDQEHIAELNTTISKLTSRVTSVQGTVEARESREQLKSETEAQTAFAVGLAATALPALPVSSMRYQLACIRNLCFDLGLHFSDDEQKQLDTPPTDSAEAQKVASIVISKAKGLSQHQWCFFALGNRRQWLFDIVERQKSTSSVLAWLEPFCRNPSLQLVPRYAHALNALLEVLRPYRVSIPDEAQVRLSMKVREIFHEFGVVFIQGHNTLTRLRRSYWFFVAEGILLCFVDEVPGVPGHVFFVGVHNSDKYDVQDVLEGTALDVAHVTRDDAGWHCSTHVDATVDDPCFDINLVLGATDGGNPPRNASGDLLAEIIVGVKLDEELKTD